MIIEAKLYEVLEDQKVHCYLCNHHCKINESKFGACGVRQNREGKLYTHAYGEVIAANTDPIEKKPFYHFLPGTTSYSVATMGCNFRCGFCQNWRISQTSYKDGPVIRGERLSPEDIVKAAQADGCSSIAYTYTEPTIFFEYAYDTAKLARENNLSNVFVTNGFMTPDALITIHPYLDACNVDLKAFSEDFYKKICHGRLEPVLESIRTMKALGIWVEVTTLVIPGQNDDREQLRAIAQFISGVDPDIPWHISRFHPEYQFDNVGPTPLSVLKTAYSAGKEVGLRYIYMGNVPGKNTETFCPICGKTLIKRAGVFISENKITNGICPDCGAKIAGVF